MQVKSLLTYALPIHTPVFHLICNCVTATCTYYVHVGRLTQYDDKSEKNQNDTIERATQWHTIPYIFIVERRCVFYTWCARTIDACWYVATMHVHRRIGFWHKGLVAGADISFWFRNWIVENRRNWFYLSMQGFVGNVKRMSWMSFHYVWNISAELWIEVDFSFSFFSLSLCLVLGFSLGLAPAICSGWYFNQLLYLTWTGNRLK